MSGLRGTTTASGPSSTTEQAKERKRRRAPSRPSAASASKVDQRSTQAGERDGSTADDIRSVSEELRKQGKEQPAKLAAQAAERAESLGSYLQRSDGDTILRDVEDFGRRQPWAVIAGGVALGFAASRFLKASSSRRYEERSRTSSTDWSQHRNGGDLTAGAPTTRTGMAPSDVTGPPTPRPPGSDYVTPAAGAPLVDNPATRLDR